MSDWTHSICPHCWNKKHPATPFVQQRDGYGETKRCCWCGFVHASGLFLRENPVSEDLWCQSATAHHDEYEEIFAHGVTK